MSGIVGIVNFGGRPVLLQELSVMISAIAHRGLDGSRIHLDGIAGFGFCETATTWEAGTQPYVASNGCVFVLDGWIENRDDLLMALSHREPNVRHGSDVELVAWSYLLWGDDFIERIDGDFALAVWNPFTRRLVCARDRMGNRPLNYRWDGRSIVFGSEIRSILVSSMATPKLNEGMLAEFLASQFHSLSETFWAGILRLPAGHILTVGPGGPSLRRFWRPEQVGKLVYRRDREYVDHHLAILQTAVQAVLRTKTRVSVEVSGGLDSSAVFAVAHKLMEEGRARAPAISGLTMSFPDDVRADESSLTREIGEFVGSHILEVAPTFKPLSWYQERAKFEMEFPGYANGVMSLGLRQKAFEMGARVHVTGMGGDEWFSDFFLRRGYYREEARAFRISNLIDWVLADRKAFGVATTAKWILLRGFFPPHRGGRIHDLFRRLRRTPAAPLASADLLSTRLRNLLDERRSRALVERASLADRSILTADPFTAWGVESEERMSARIGLELRHPLRSRSVVEYGLSLPDRFLVRGGTAKYLHRKAMEGLLPARVLSIGNKANFAGVMERHLEKVGNFRDSGPFGREWFSNVGLKELSADQNAFGSQLSASQRLWVISGYIGCKALLEDHG